MIHPFCRGSVVFFSVCIFIVLSVHAYAFDAVIAPDAIKPGDPFVVKVSGSVTEPVAVFEGRKLAAATCGKECYFFVAATDVEAESGSSRIIRISNETKNTELQFRLAPGSFPEIHLTLAQDKVVLSPENLKRAEAEKKRLNQLFSQTNDKIWTDSFAYPLSTEVSSHFGVKRIINKKTNSIHRGIDMRAKTGDPVKAVNAGRVALAEELFFGGNTIIVDHGLGIFSIYMHLSELKVQEGDFVALGKVVGLAGSTGRSSGPHLHFGIKVQSVSVNPVSFLGLGI